MYEDSDRRSSSHHRAPSATVPPFGRGPSQAADFFSAQGAPSILEVEECRDVLHTSGHSWDNCRALSLPADCSGTGRNLFQNRRKAPLLFFRGVLRFVVYSLNTTSGVRAHRTAQNPFTELELPIPLGSPSMCCGVIDFHGLRGCSQELSPLDPLPFFKRLRTVTLRVW